jgi:hypothetical protein
VPSNVEICNLALADLGDSATVVTIDPPEGSAQAEHCQRFYPIALYALLELHQWSFATKRMALTAVDNPSSTWAYAYQVPNLCMSIISILDPGALNDYSAENVSGTVGIYQPQSYVRETDADGNQIILTNQADAVARYTVVVTDTSKFTPLFVLCLSCMLRSMLAGPVLKGAEGRAESKAAKQELVTYWLPKATASDGNDRRVDPVQEVSWIANR